MVIWKRQKKTPLFIFLPCSHDRVPELPNWSRSIDEDCKRKKGKKTHSKLDDQIVVVMVVCREIWMRKED